jgi:hypothetical protein
MTFTNKSWFIGIAVASIVVAFGCLPVQPSEQKLVGKWRVVWNCGTEDLDLKSDMSYVLEIEYARGGHAKHVGTWCVTPKESRFEGAHVVLQDAVTFCSPFGEKLTQPVRGERKLETVWEWGRMILSFSPDWQGFERLK